MRKNKIENSLNDSILEKTKKMTYVFFKNSFFYILIIGIIAISLRLYYFEADIPSALDNLEYLLYAYDTSILGHLPEDYTPANNGWPSFLSMFFSIAHYDNPFQYMELQKIISIVISTLTIIPVYILCRNFFSTHYSLIGASIFAFEPHIILNSLLGITEPLYIILVSMTIVMILSRNTTIMYMSFAIASFATIVRAESIIMFFIISIIFFIKHKKTSYKIPKYVIAAIIFFLILFPMALYKQDIQGDDRVFGRISEALSDDKAGIFYSENEENILITGIINFSKFFAWNMIPIFILFIPIGIIQIFQKFNYKKLAVLISIVGMSIPAFYAYSLSALDTRYLYVLFPMLCVISIFGLERYFEKIKNTKIISVLIIGGIILVSFVFLEYQKIDADYENDAFIVAQYVVKNTGGVNYYSPGSQYIKVAEVIKNWPELPPHSYDGHFEVLMPRFSTNNYNSLQEFLIDSKDNGLTHLVIDNSSTRPIFLKDVFNNEKNFPYLIKEYDSKDRGLNYHVKIFKIDYEKLESHMLLIGKS